MRHLREEHRAEFAGADQRDANRLSGGEAGIEQTMKVHEGPIGLSRHSGMRLLAQTRNPEMAGEIPGSLAGASAPE